MTFRFSLLAVAMVSVISLLSEASADNTIVYVAERLPTPVHHADGFFDPSPTIRTFNNQAFYTQHRIIPPSSQSMPVFVAHATLVTGLPGNPTFTHVVPIGNDKDVVEYGLNDQGDLVGVSHQGDRFNDSQQDAFYRSFGGTTTLLPSINHGSNARDINNSNTIVGHSFTDPIGNHQVATRWTQSNGMWSVENLGNFGQENATALDVNNVGQVLIHAFSGSIPDGTRTNSYHILETDGSITNLLGPGLTGGTIAANKINDLGQVIILDQFRDQFNSMLWDPINGYIDTGLDRISDINNHGVVVGQLYENGDWRQAIGYIWDNGQLTAINDLLQDQSLNINETRFINDAGQILAYDEASGPFGPALLLTPTIIPEPSAWICLAGLIALISTKRQKLLRN